MKKEIVMARIVLAALVLGLCASLAPPVRAQTNEMCMLRCLDHSLYQICEARCTKPAPRGQAPTPNAAAPTNAPPAASTPPSPVAAPSAPPSSAQAAPAVTTPQPPARPAANPAPLQPAAAQAAPRQSAKPSAPPPSEDRRRQCLASREDRPGPATPDPPAHKSGYALGV